MSEKIVLVLELNDCALCKGTITELKDISEVAKDVEETRLNNPRILKGKELVITPDHNAHGLETGSYHVSIREAKE